MNVDIEVGIWRRGVGELPNSSESWALQVPFAAFLQPHRFVPSRHDRQPEALSLTTDSLNIGPVTYFSALTFSDSFVITAPIVVCYMRKKIVPDLLSQLACL